MEGLLVTAVVLLRMAAVPAQTLEATEPADPPRPAALAPVTMFEHPDTTRFWLSGQVNIIVQYHPPFHAAYSGPNSLQSNSARLR